MTDAKTQKDQQGSRNCFLFAINIRSNEKSQAEERVSDLKI